MFLLLLEIDDMSINEQWVVYARMLECVKMI